MTKNVHNRTKDAPQKEDDSEATGSQFTELTEGSKKMEVDGPQTQSCSDAGTPAEEETEVLSWNAAWQEPPVVCGIVQADKH